MFGTQAFEPGLWGLIALLALAFGVLEETRKYAVRRWARPRPAPEPGLVRPGAKEVQ
jgi:hypothetical protein